MKNLQWRADVVVELIVHCFDGFYSGTQTRRILKVVKLESIRLAGIYPELRARFVCKLDLVQSISKKTEDHFEESRIEFFLLATLGLHLHFSMLLT
ncbi:MAG: hypothetical protein U0936_11140 [Planctomycetaceae bacterium]